MQVVTNFLRMFGGPIHMTMRRYRFVEEGLTLGKRETEHVIDQTRKSHKLWNRVEEQQAASIEDDESLNHYRHVLRNKYQLFFAGLAEMLEKKVEKPCAECYYRDTYRTTEAYTFRGTPLCKQCQEKWRVYIWDLHARIRRSFPEIGDTLRASRLRDGTSK